MQGGVAGFTLGVGKGLVGAAIRPAAGVLQLTASCANAASAAGGEVKGEANERESSIWTCTQSRLPLPLSESHLSHLSQLALTVKTFRPIRTSGVTHAQLSAAMGLPVAHHPAGCARRLRARRAAAT